MDCSCQWDEKRTKMKHQLHVTWFIRLKGIHTSFQLKSCSKSEIDRHALDLPNFLRDEQILSRQSKVVTNLYKIEGNTRFGVNKNLLYIVVLPHWCILHAIKNHGLGPRFDTPYIIKFETQLQQQLHSRRKRFCIFSDYQLQSRTNQQCWKKFSSAT